MDSNLTIFNKTDPKNKTHLDIKGGDILNSVYYYCNKECTIYKIESIIVRPTDTYAHIVIYCNKKWTTIVIDKVDIVGYSPEQLQRSSFRVKWGKQRPTLFYTKENAVKYIIGLNKKEMNTLAKYKEQYDNKLKNIKALSDNANELGKDYPEYLI